LFLRIGHIISPYFAALEDQGGTGRVVHDLICKQIEKGHEVFVLGGPLTTIENVEVLSLIKPANRPRNWFVRWLMERKEGSVHYYRGIKLLKDKVDIIHNHLSEEGIGLSFLKETPQLNTLHGLAFDQKDLSRYWATRFFATCGKTKLVAISKAAFYAQQKMYGKDLIGYVYNGIDCERFEFVAKPAKTHDIELCFAGRADPRKGVHIAICVADRLLSMGYDVALKIILLYEPRYPEYFRKIMQMAKCKSNVEVFIELSYSKVFDILSNSDALLFPIQWEEPFGIIQIESMNCGTPVVAFSRGAAPEVVQNGINGYLCNDVDQMCKAVLDLNKISRLRCRTTVEESFSSDVMCEKYLEFYEKAINAYGKGES
jgi:glycosyltransferase involved in cell wall biosynthesis